MSTKSRFYNGILEFFDSVTYERVKPLAPVVFEDDFLYRTLNVTDRWRAIDVSSAGDTKPLVVADGINGIGRMPLDSTSEAQESGLDWNDQRFFVLNQGLVWEARVALQTLPTLLSIAVWGLAGDKNAVADTVAESIWFRVEGNGVVTVESDDTVNEQNDIDAAKTLTAGTFAIFRIDCTTITSVKFYIDGAQVAGGTTFNMSQVAGLKLQPYMVIQKASGAGLGVLEVDYVRVWQKRS